MKPGIRLQLIKAEKALLLALRLDKVMSFGRVNFFLEKSLLGGLPKNPWISSTIFLTWRLKFAILKSVIISITLLKILFVHVLLLDYCRCVQALKCQTIIQVWCLFKHQTVITASSHWSGMRPSDRICWPATQKEVWHSSLNDWFDGDKLSFGMSRMDVERPQWRAWWYAAVFKLKNNCQELVSK